MRTTWGRLTAAAATVLVGSVLTAVPASAADPVTIQLFDINDFHGRIDANTVKFAGTVEQLRAQAGEGKSLFLSAGDNIGASLFASATLKDEPTIDVLNALDLDVSAVGNHEFDKGADDLTGRVSERADFPYIAANVIDKTTGKPLLPASETFMVGGLKVAVVGAVTGETPSLVSPAGIANLEFTDPVAAVNKTVAELNASADKPDVIVADYHEGAGAGTPDGATIQQEIAAGGAFADIVTKTDASVDAIFTGHTHKQYAWDAPIPGGSGTRPILQTGSYGENIGNIGLTVDPDTDQVTGYTVKNVPRTTTADDTLVSTYPRVAAVKPIVDAALANAKKVGETPVGEVTDDITTAYNGSNRDDRANESTLGNLVSDAVLAQVKKTTAGADLAVTNPGGLRNELFFTKDPNVASDRDGSVNYAEANAVLPFVNNLSSVTLSGASLKKVFEQQWQTNADGTIPSRPFLALGSSSNVRWTYDDTRPAGDRITSLWVNDQPVSPTASYKVAVPSFLVSGGDNFRAFTEGKGVDTGLVDYEAWIDYLQKNQPLSPSFARHAVKATGVKSEYRVGSDLSVTLAKLNLTSLGSPANKSVSAKLLKGGEVVKNLGSTSVTDGTVTVAGTLPAGVTGSLVLDVTAYPSGTHTTIPLTVKGATITATADDAVYGDDTTVHVTAAAPGDAPTGTVTVLSGTTEVGSGTLADGQADITVDTEQIGAGTKDLTVAYAGAGDLPAAQGTASVTVAKAATSSSVTVDPNARRGQPVDVTVDVASATGTTPTGTVTLKHGDTTLGSGTLSDGSVTVAADASSLPIGSTTISVVYEGDDNHVTSTTTADVDLAKGLVVFTATAPAPTPYGTSAKVEVSSDSDARGLVYVTDGSKVVGIGVLDGGTGGVFLDKTALEPGTHELRAYFGGSADYEPTDVPVSVTITKAPSRTTARVTTSKVVQKKTKAKVAVTVSATGFAPSGKVTVKKGSKLLGTGTVKNGKAVVTLRAFTHLGTARLTVSYAGDQHALPSSGTTSLKVVTR